MKNIKGLTTFQTIVGMVLVVIIISIAYPMYRDHVITEKRERAEDILLRIADRLTRYHSLYGTYVSVTLDRIQFNPPSEASGYQYNITDQTQDNFSLTAVPVGSQNRDIHCQNLTLSSLGEKGSDGDWKASDCWETYMTDADSE